MTRVAELDPQVLSKWFWDPAVDDYRNISKKLKTLYRAMEFPLSESVIWQLCAIASLLNLDDHAPVMIALKEYLLTLDLSIRQREHIPSARLYSLSRLGIAKHVVEPDRKYMIWRSPHDKDCPSDWIVDEEALNAKVKEGLGHYGTLDSVLGIVRTMIGLYAGIHRHKTMGYSVSSEEFLHPERFEPTGAYERFLESDARTLDESETFGEADSLELARAARNRSSDYYAVDPQKYPHLYFSLAGGEIVDDAAVALAETAGELADKATSIALNEYLLSVVNNEKTIQRLYVTRHLTLLLCGIAERVPQKYAGRDFKDFGRFPDAFDIDSKELDEVIRSAVGSRDNLRAAFEAVGRMISVQAGLGRHKTISSPREVPHKEYYNADQFEIADNYFMSFEKVWDS